MKKNLGLIVIFLSLGAFLAYYFISNQSAEKYFDKIEVIDSYDKCVAAGYPVMESYPTQCRTPDGKTFINDEEIFCTMDAMVCPDGTSVGRIPPNCEFAPCPSKN